MSGGSLCQVCRWYDIGLRPNLSSHLALDVASVWVMFSGGSGSGRTTAEAGNDGLLAFKCSFIQRYRTKKSMSHIHVHCLHVQSLGKLTDPGVGRTAVIPGIKGWRTWTSAKVTPESVLQPRKGLASSAKKSSSSQAPHPHHQGAGEYLIVAHLLAAGVTVSTAAACSQLHSIHVFALISLERETVSLPAHRWPNHSPGHQGELQGSCG